MQSERFPRSWWTTATSLLVLLMTIPYVIAGIDLWRTAYGQAPIDAISREAIVELGLSPVEAGNLFVIFFWVFVIVISYVVVLAVGIYLLKPWARYGAILTFAFFGLLMFPMALAGMTWDPPTENGWLGMLLALADFTAVVLLLIRPVSEDFEDAEFAANRPIPPDPTMPDGPIAPASSR